MYLTVYLCIRGFYPKGGGEVLVTVNPIKELTPVTMTERGNITKIYGRAYVAGVLPFKVKFTLTHITHFMVFTASTVVFLFFLCTGLFFQSFINFPVHNFFFVIFFVNTVTANELVLATCYVSERIICAHY